MNYQTLIIMKKVLVSWIATNHDFLRKNNDGEIVQTETSYNEEGPHFSLYKDFGDDIDIHYLLCQDLEDRLDKKWSKFAGTLRNQFNKQVILKFMGVDDVFSVGTIKGKIEQLVKFQLKDMDVEVFMNPGTPAMQTAWYLLGSELADRKNLTFFRRRERRFTEDGGIPPKEIAEFEVSKYPKITNIRDNYRNGRVRSKHKNLITSSTKEIYTRALQLASNNNTPVLIIGDIGTGKNHLANYIHSNSNRKNQSLVTINCAAYREDVLENTLLGVEKGAFSGATILKTGIFEQTKGGTIILKEVDTLSLRMQAVLYEIINEKAIYRVGSHRKISIDVRLILTTTKKLWNLAEQGVFRWDLYNRLSIAEFSLPTLFQIKKAERKQWIDYFMESTYTKLETRYIEKIETSVQNFLLSYPFYGNLRELQNVIETFYTFCEDKITKKDIPLRMLEKNIQASLKLDDVIKEHVRKVHAFCEGNISETAKLVGRDRATVRNNLK